ncbi:hypothetical protein QEW_4462 [Clostridioides difficile CD160]|nr:hypothetical protein QEW_4462 [Clostridioides difficile CD160]
MVENHKKEALQGDKRYRRSYIEAYQRIKNIKVEVWIFKI